jgi:hypothetical protein
MREEASPANLYVLAKQLAVQLAVQLLLQLAVQQLMGALR